MMRAWIIVFVVVFHRFPPFFARGHYPGTHHHPTFLKHTYHVKGDKDQAFYIRQVPGDGSCLFHAISAWISFIITENHCDFDWRLRNLSNKLRHLSLEILRSNRTLITENGECIDSINLLELVADHYNITSTEYCNQMTNPKIWGGGPEIVALSNYFECPIHVYSLAKGGIITNPSFKLELCAKFGSPNFDENCPIQLLIADGRFPHIRPGHQKEIGDHFLALFPYKMLKINNIKRSRGKSNPHAKDQVKAIHSTTSTSSCYENLKQRYHFADFSMLGFPHAAKPNNHPIPFIQATDGTGMNLLEALNHEASKLIKNTQNSLGFMADAPHPHPNSPTTSSIASTTPIYMQLKDSNNGDPPLLIRSWFNSFLGKK